MTRPRAVVISPAFFGYEAAIVEEFEAQGYSTRFIDERFSNTAFARAVLRTGSAKVSPLVDAYYRRVLESLGGDRIDLVLVIKAEVVPRWFLVSLRERNPAATLIFYTFDSLSRVGNCRDVLDVFDHRLTFDRSDADREPMFEYLPLFYTSEFRADNPPIERCRELTFVGTLHSERYAIAKRLFTGWQRTFAFFYVPARWYFFLVKYVTREHRLVPWKDVSFAKLTRSDIARLFATSHAVLDIQRDGQAGLTMRTFEALAAGAVLVTTNSAIRSEPFFDPSRIVVIPDNVDSVDLSDLADQLRNCRSGEPPAEFSDYSLASWVRALRKLVS